ncbi:MAG: glucose-6-phosphate dehydrogenase assembly protein OpcA [Actinobacteria bacterium]|nr:glucose-6-phosphate dehydrogenase assembly protein OpcA [Actinomycetota bacterium]
MIRLEDTSGGAVAATINQERNRLGSSPTGMVLTLLIMATEETQADATAAAVAAARLHPMRIITMVPRPTDPNTRLDADISVGGDDGPGEVAILRLRGRLAEHANSVAVPLLPLVAYWPGVAPRVPADDPIGRHAQRRITDAAGALDPLRDLLTRRKGYQPGDTDLAWTRLTPWRSVLASALDQPFGTITGASVSGERGNPSVPLLTSWLHLRLGVPVILNSDDGPGLTGAAIDFLAAPSPGSTRDSQQ